MNGVLERPTPFEYDQPSEAAFLMGLYLEKPKHLIILETLDGFKLHMCYFPNEQWYFPS